MNDPRCTGCKHAEDTKDGWCYMFSEAPSMLPCGQHDKFAELRRVTGKAIRKHPAILIGMVLEAMEDMRMRGEKP